MAVLVNQAVASSISVASRVWGSTNVTVCSVTSVSVRRSCDRSSVLELPGVGGG